MFNRNKLFIQASMTFCISLSAAIIIYIYFQSNIYLLSILIFILIIFNIKILYTFFHRVNKIKSQINAIYKDNFIFDNSTESFELLINQIDKISQKLKNDRLELNKVSKVRTEFLANVSHELKTPIFAIKGFTETLLDGALEDHKVNKKFVENIETQANRLENLFSDLIDISKIESNQLVLKLNRFKLQRLINWSRDTFSESINNKGIKFIVPDCKDLNVVGDEKYLKLVFSNLINNAINYSNSGSIIIAAKLIQNKVKISITDNGIGIDKKHINRIFERFYRVDSDRSRQSGGTGLGLSIVKHILEAHGTDIKVESDISMGSIFSFELNNI
tara:strand:- start:451 stop:1446 length:996 start_codon:yes stop_codon:yes gene_type:complete